MTKTPTDIRKALIDEAERLLHEGAEKPAHGLLSFATLATDAEIERFRDIIVGTETTAA